MFLKAQYCAVFRLFDFLFHDCSCCNNSRQQEQNVCLISSLHSPSTKVSVTGQLGEFKLALTLFSIKQSLVVLESQARKTVLTLPARCQVTTQHTRVDCHSSLVRMSKCESKKLWYLSQSVFKGRREGEIEVGAINHQSRDEGSLSKLGKAESRLLAGTTKINKLCCNQWEQF